MDDVTLTDETSRIRHSGAEGPKAAAMVQELAGIDVTKWRIFLSAMVPSAQFPAGSRSVILGNPGAEFFTETANLPALGNSF